MSLIIGGKILYFIKNIHTAVNYEVSKFFFSINNFLTPATSRYTKCLIVFVLIISIFQFLYDIFNANGKKSITKLHMVEKIYVSILFRIVNK